MIKTIHIEIPAKPVVKQYITNAYGAPIVFPEGDWLKLLFHNLLCRAKENADGKFNLQYYTERVMFPLSFRSYEHYGNTLSKEAVVAINSRVEELIHQRLFMFYEHFHYIIGFTVKDTARHFQQVYNFPEEIYSTDNIIKQFQRNIKPVLSQKNIAESVLRSYQHERKGGNNVTKASAERISAFKTIYLSGR